MSKAIEYIEKNQFYASALVDKGIHDLNVVTSMDADCAIIIAVKEMKEKAIECHQKGCVKAKCPANTIFNNGVGNNICDGNCEYMGIFKRLLNK